MGSRYRCENGRLVRWMRNACEKTSMPGGAVGLMGRIAVEAICNNKKDDKMGVGLGLGWSVQSLFPLTNLSRRFWILE